MWRNVHHIASDLHVINCYGKLVKGCKYEVPSACSFQDKCCYMLKNIFLRKMGSEFLPTFDTFQLHILDCLHPPNFSLS
jgi:hypothetical protein